MEEYYDVGSLWHKFRSKSFQVAERKKSTDSTSLWYKLTRIYSILIFPFYKDLEIIIDNLKNQAKKN